MQLLEPEETELFVGVRRNSSPRAGQTAAMVDEEAIFMSKEFAIFIFSLHTDTKRNTRPSGEKTAEARAFMEQTARI